MSIWVRLPIRTAPRRRATSAPPPLGRLALTGLLLTAAFAVRQQAATGEEFEARILQDLRQLNPAAVTLFTEADAARAAGRHREAADLYARVHEMAPGFDHALRRQCGEELALGDRPRALLLCRRALALDESPENQAALARALVAGSEVMGPTERERAEAVGLAWRATETHPDGESEMAALCEAGFAAQDIPALRRCAAFLQAREPDEARTHYFFFLIAAIEGRYDDARAALDRARELGMPEEDYRRLRAGLDRADPLLPRLLPIAGMAGAAWLGGLLLLLLVGLGLSRAALRAARRPPAEANGRAAGLDVILRRAYGVTLWLCCGYYYLSIPIVALLVLLAGGGTIYAFLSVGHIPVKLVLIVAFFTLVSLWAILRSLFTLRGGNEEPGRRLSLEEHAEFARMLRDVAGEVGTAPVDTVYITPGTEVAVMERGGLLRQMSGRSERCLILGVAALDGMRLGPFRAVLAHEYGHLSNRDTAGGRFAIAVRRSLLTMAGLLAQSGAAKPYNPAWIFVNGFYRVFLRISQGATRLQEVLADRWAAATYGAADFEAGLRHVIERGVRFSAHADAAIREVIDRKSTLANIYSYVPTKAPDPAAIDAAVATAIAGKPTPYDSHPPPLERFAYVRQVPAGTRAGRGDADREVWSLFHDRDALEMEMTAGIRGNILARYGVDIPAGEPVTA